MFTTKAIRKSSQLAVLALSTALCGQAAYATATPVDQSALVQTAAISKQRAVAIALQAVGGGTVVLAILERENHFAHWSIDIRGATDEYEVWVNLHGKVIRIITQPL